MSIRKIYYMCDMQTEFESVGIEITEREALDVILMLESWSWLLCWDEDDECYTLFDTDTGEQWSEGGITLDELINTLVELEEMDDNESFREEYYEEIQSIYNIKNRIQEVA